VETIARIRREPFIKGKTIKELAGTCKVSRTRSGRCEVGRDSFEYERGCPATARSWDDGQLIEGLLAGKRGQVRSRAN